MCYSLRIPQATINLSMWHRYNTVILFSTVPIFLGVCYFQNVYNVGRGSGGGSGYGVMSRSCLNGSRKESVVPHEADVMADFEDWLDGLSEASGHEFELLGKELDDLDASMSAGAASAAFVVVPVKAAPLSMLAIMDEEIGDIDGFSKVAPGPCTLTEAAKKKQAKKDGGCSDDARRRGLTHLSTSIGHYPRNLKPVGKGANKKGGKGGGKTNVGKVAREAKPAVG